MTQIIDGVLISRKGHDGVTAELPATTARAVRALVVVFTIGVAMALPYFGHVISLLGSIAYSLVGFIVPTVVHLKTAESLETVDKLFAAVVIIFGAFVTVSGTAANVAQLIKGAE